MQGENGVFVAASDFMKALPNHIARWFPGRFIALGTDGFGLSESREELREHFEVNAHYIAWAALCGLFGDDLIDHKLLSRARKDLGIAESKQNPAWF